MKFSGLQQDKSYCKGYHKGELVYGLQQGGYYSAVGVSIATAWHDTSASSPMDIPSPATYYSKRGSYCRWLYGVVGIVGLWEAHRHARCSSSALMANMSR